ncbi:DUF1579 domain-containing protein [soil metagenome]
MKAFLMAGLLACAMFSVSQCGVSLAADVPMMPKPEKEHEWLKAFVGEWENEGECAMDPKNPQKCKGTETVKSLGGFWIVSEMKGDFGGMPITGTMTLGYDANKKKYVGTWVDSMTPLLWKYEGTVDSTGKILTLESEGPNMLDPTKTCKFRDITEFKADGTRVAKNMMEGPDGKWITVMTMTATKKK